VKPETLCEYLRYKYEKGNVPVNQYNTEIPIRIRISPRETYVLHSTADWNAPVVLNKLQASVKFLHFHYPLLRGEYQDACVDCMVLNQSEGGVLSVHQGCIHHLGRPLLVPNGCPITSEPYKREVYRGKDLLKEHRVQGAQVLLPGDVRDLPSVLLGTYLQGLQIYTMILLGIKLFLRSNELLGITVEDFKERLYIVNQDDVRGIAIGVKGKCDTTRQYLYIWPDDHCPDFCPLRHLLVYVALSRLKEGFLFPYFKRGKHH
jgi:hypothetical protein